VSTAEVVKNCNWTAQWKDIESAVFNGSSIAEKTAILDKQLFRSPKEQRTHSINGSSILEGSSISEN